MGEKEIENLHLLIEKFPGYRSDILFFVRLAGTYIQSIFWDAISASNKKAKRRRKHLLELANKTIKNSHLKNAIINPSVRWHQTLDCFKKEFLNFLKILDKPGNKTLELASVSSVFEDRLRLRHGIFFKDLSEFIKIIETLLEGRNYFEHYKERTERKKERNFVYEDVVQAFGLFLPSDFCYLFVDRITSWQHKLSSQEDKNKIEECKTYIKIFLEKKRCENVSRLFSEERKRSKIPDKNKRKALINKNQKWFKCYEETSRQYKDDYKEYNFMRKYYFIGEQNINAIKSSIKYKNISFKRDIEPLYLLTVKVNLIIHNVIAGFGNNDLKKNQELSDIRNTVAHNGLFWSVRNKNNEVYEIKQVFMVLITAIVEKHNKEKLNDFYSRIYSLLQKEKYAFVDKISDHLPQPKQRVRRWTQENRKNYINPDYSRDKRYYFKKIIRLWIKALKEAKTEAISVVKHEKNCYKKAARNMF